MAEGGPAPPPPSASSMMPVVGVAETVRAILSILRRNASMIPLTDAPTQCQHGCCFSARERCCASAPHPVEDRRANLAKMEPSAHISEEMEDLEELIDDVKEVMVEHKNMAFTEVETLKRKLSSSSPSGKVVEVAKAPRLDTAKAIGSSGPGTA